MLNVLISRKFYFKKVKTFPGILSLPITYPKRSYPKRLADPSQLPVLQIVVKRVANMSLSELFRDVLLGL